ncbi:response regulator [Fodinibius saliphilus]|uniref:response regulator n=1 Tax=Fodinibius saliphilus TaxID=1920650 RepID=UPI001108EBD1|nr:response regulator [Fodinibius saliphilus]
MNEIKIFWIEDDLTFGNTVHLRIEDELEDNGISLADPELSKNGDGFRNVMRDWEPDIIMMDHNLDNVRVNGANLIVEIRLYDNDTPIIFYSSEMDQTLTDMVDGEQNIKISQRNNVHDELLTLILKEFTPA